MKIRTILLVLWTCCASAGLAQTLTIGNVFNATAPRGGGMLPSGEARTFIDLAHPATASGTVTRVGFGWYCWGDPPSVKIKFFRPGLSALVLVAERGPYTIDRRDDETFEISPPVSVARGDLIGITRLAIDRAFGPVVLLIGGEYLEYGGDVMTPVMENSAKRGVGSLALWGTGESGAYRARVLPVVGSTSGAASAVWKTSVQLLNPYQKTATGRLVFHPAGTSASPADPGISYTLAPGATQMFADVVAAMGRSGIGSMDVMTELDGEAGMPPLVLARIYNDRDNAGTVGFTEEAFDPKGVGSQCASSSGTFVGTRILRAGVAGYLVAPADASRTRFNIGVRTLDLGAKVNVMLYTEAGELANTVTKEYPANYFEQLTAQDLLGVPLTGGESIKVSIVEGSAIIYGSSVDNLTNDPAMQYVYSRFAIAEQ